MRLYNDQIDLRTALCKISRHRVSSWGLSFIANGQHCKISVTLVCVASRCCLLQRSPIPKTIAANWLSPLLLRKAMFIANGHALGGVAAAVGEENIGYVFLHPAPQSIEVQKVH